MRKQTKLTCPKCNKEYYKDESEYLRNIKKNRESFCSIKCAADINKIPKELRGTFNLTEYNRNNQKENPFKMFKIYLKSIKNSNRLKDKNVTLQDLKDQWELQEGICPYTNFKLKLRCHSDGAVNKELDWYLYASVDRIDSTKGYVKGNIEFISLPINLMKNRYTKEQTKEFISLLINTSVNS